MQEEGVTELLQAPAHSGVPGVVGTRCLSDNLSDLKAQVAANSKGISLVATLISEYSLPVVQAYMTHIQANAEASVRKMLVDFSLSQVLPRVTRSHQGCQCCCQLLMHPYRHNLSVAMHMILHCESNTAAVT